MVLNTINDNDELIYSFLGWAPLLSKRMVPTNANKRSWFLLVVKSKLKLTVDDFNCLGYLSAILAVIILTTRRTQRKMIQAIITCTYRKMLVFPIFP